MSNGVCVQLGLHNTAEFYLLTNYNWIDKIDPNDFELKLIPKYFPDVISWSYYGVDYNPCSIARMIQKYPERPKAHWICAAVLSYRKKLASVAWDWDNNKNVWASAITLKEILIFAGGSIDILKMDIEGAEIEIFQTYDFQIKPKYLSISLHPAENKKERAHNGVHLSSILEENGYKVFCRSDELTGILKDVPS